MNKLIALILICFTGLISPLSLADENTVHLDKGEPAPFSGFLLDPARSQRVYTLDLDLQTCTKVSDLKSQEIDIGNTRITNANKEIDHLSERLAKEQDTFWKNVGMFILGAATATAISFAAARAVR
jgi:hypothetical protein